MEVRSYLKRPLFYENAKGNRNLLREIIIIENNFKCVAQVNVDGFLLDLFLCVPWL